MTGSPVKKNNVTTAASLDKMPWLAWLVSPVHATYSLFTSPGKKINFCQKHFIPNDIAHRSKELQLFAIVSCSLNYLATTVLLCCCFLLILFSSWHSLSVAVELFGEKLPQRHKFVKDPHFVSSRAEGKNGINKYLTWLTLAGEIYLGK